MSNRPLLARRFVTGSKAYTRIDQGEYEAQGGIGE